MLGASYAHFTEKGVYHRYGRISFQRKRPDSKPFQKERAFNPCKTYGAYNGDNSYSGSCIYARYARKWCA